MQGARQQAVGGAVQGAADALHRRAGAEGADPADGGHDSVRAAHSTAGTSTHPQRFQTVFLLGYKKESMSLSPQLRSLFAGSATRRGSPPRTTSSSSGCRPWSSRRSCATVRNDPALFDSNCRTEFRVNYMFRPLLVQCPFASCSEFPIRSHGRGGAGRDRRVGVWRHTQWQLVVVMLRRYATS